MGENGNVSAELLFDPAIFMMSRMFSYLDKFIKGLDMLSAVTLRLEYGLRGFGASLKNIR